jgi:hypothetical protein
MRALITKVYRLQIYIFKRIIFKKSLFVIIGLGRRVAVQKTTPAMLKNAV